jgi:hypothetical protein
MAKHTYNLPMAFRMPINRRIGRKEGLTGGLVFSSIRHLGIQHLGLHVGL